MQTLIKSTVIWATLGSVMGASAVVVLNGQQVSVAEHWGEIIAAVGAGVAALAAAFVTAMKKKQG